MSDTFIGEIRMFGFNFAPRGWVFCQGQLLSIAQNTALFSLLGTNYGGDGQTTFGLPDLRGRVPLHFGQGPGQPDYVLGQKAGEESVTLLTSEMPQHTHQAVALSASDAGDPSTDAVWATPPEAMYGGLPPVNTNGAIGGAMSPLALEFIGGSQPHNNMPPFVVVNYSIALEGIFPARN